jgi:hypothetical protein
VALAKGSKSGDPFINLNEWEKMTAQASMSRMKSKLLLRNAFVPIPRMLSSHSVGSREYIAQFESA